MKWLCMAQYGGNPLGKNTLSELYLEKKRKEKMWKTHVGLISRQLGVEL